MPPKTTFTKTDVVDAAMAIVIEQGLKELTTRKVAEKLGSSPAPVYSCFDSKFGLEKEVIKQIKDLLYQYSTNDYTEFYTLNMAVGLVLFARDYNQLFKSMFLQNNEFTNIVTEFKKYHLKAMEEYDRFSGMPLEERDQLLTKLWIFTHGFATLISTGMIENRSEQYVISTLKEVGTLIIEDALHGSET